LTLTIIGVPPIVDAFLMQKAVYERTDPHITPTFDWIEVPEGHGRILVMNIYPGMPPYTETNGSATIRVGKKTGVSCYGKSKNDNG